MLVFFFALVGLSLPSALLSTHITCAVSEHWNGSYCVGSENLSFTVATVNNGASGARPHLLSRKKEKKKKKKKTKTKNIYIKKCPQKVL